MVMIINIYLMLTMCQELWWMLSIVLPFLIPSKSLSGRSYYKVQLHFIVKVLEAQRVKSSALVTYHACRWAGSLNSRAHVLRLSLWRLSNWLWWTILSMLNLSHTYFHQDFYSFIDTANLTIVFCFGAIFPKFLNQLCI